MGNSAAPPPHLRIHAVNIYVRDQDRSLRFYLDQLGFNLAFDAKFGSGGRGVRFGHPPRLKRFKYERPVTAPSTPPGDDTPIWGAVFTRFKDLDGNSFALVGFDAVSREVEAQRRALAQRLEAERRAAQELEIAKQVQARLFPQELPAMRTLEYAGACMQARQVGGDYYDFLSLGRDRVGLVIGDIAGKGIAGALHMASLQANLRSQCAIARD